ncbi:MAG: sigma-70 family RNA polymerase sigma factor [Acidobacteriota bacterium]|nr:sigma-70 family RNA polymerase sigma factor [Acidobacteriota bacterium]
MLGNLAEGDLIRRAQAGDAAAFDHLVRHYGRLVLSLARRIVRHSQDAEDVAQEAFLRFYRSLDRVDPDRPLQPWLVRLTLNAARNHVSRNPAQGEQPLTGECKGSAPGAAEASLAAGDIRKALTLALATIPERERVVFILRDLQGLEVRVIAEALKLSPVTIRRQSTSARHKVVAWIRLHRPDLLTRGE